MTVLEVQDIHKSYGENEILKGVSLSIEKGQVLVLLGPSGSGKSTLLRTLNGLETIDQGNIIFNGQSLIQSEKAWQKVRPEIGMVFQSYDLFPNLTVLENILLGPLKVQKKKRALIESEALNLLERVGLQSKAEAYPRELSGGQKQRVAIVRALIMKPQLLLFDEVTASLDPEMVREVLLVIQDLAAEGMTMFIVTHEMNFARQVADQIIFMDAGKILVTADSETFFNRVESPRVEQFLSSLAF
ncbi:MULTISPECIES: amino acid ABC transporter ATP-binding protein [unclassified Enterococcus]|uniref:amino acid ABC transporter ATP-binding protein n=1 Tax=unclassified Enterococcus TaxID=2608891 RepID=UPI00155513C6|nr:MULTISPECIES: amino acid ABC transporter ATP-binding protein [unclassified Enterococcus]MBS7577941.1 amino acid ABC transporter ATP-binding protein [Enterococcus sp. MMGLQ5-2]MBS7585198.1 amino acid ABC transporter ATP-binding protein [Enterococcus sp. MMGLQ5-1]NPD13055.1 amino acid ABC transporter ATP-binding protein [Enterococcus sp. MMGLQ5-1]NPD37771.1 amino acid ABC transporter ATP-binding protein [Enterococcus sp. MMGLQ5-2]